MRMEGFQPFIRFDFAISHEISIFVVPKRTGELSEWLKEPASKTGVRQRTGGSNPSLTAKRNKNSATSSLDCAIFMTVCKAPRSGAGMWMAEGQTNPAGE